MKNYADLLQPIFVAGLLLTFITVAHAQFTGSVVEGTVLDRSAAAVPNTKVTVTNQATGVSFSAVTSNTGFSAFPRCRGESIVWRLRPRASNRGSNGISS